MATVRELQGKLNSVKNIKKITQAMELVAAARLKKAQAKAEASRPYARELKNVLDNLLLATDDLQNPLLLEREVKKTCFVVISGDRGLCGSYNQNIFSTTEKKLKNFTPNQVELVLVGKKAVDHFAGSKWKIAKSISEWGGKITFHEIEELTYFLLDQYLNHKFDEVWLIYTHYINIASREIKIEKLLNIEHSKTNIKADTFNTIFEPDVNTIFSSILPRHSVTKVQAALNEAYASELGARIFSMRAATKNAEEMIEKLTLVRNKLRQASITKELIEITSCVEALK